MSFAQLFGILLARWKVMAVTFLAVVGVAFTLTLVLPKKYTAVTSIVVDFKGQDSILGLLMPSQMLPGYMATQVDILTSHKVALEAVKALHITESPFLKEQFKEETEGKGTIEDWMAAILLKNIDVKPSRESSVVDVSFTASDPNFAALVANAWADAYQRTNLELKVEPAKQNAAWFEDKLKVLRANLEKTTGDLNKYQQHKGIVATDDRLDVEMAKLNEMTQQLVTAQTARSDAMSRQRQLRDFLARGANPDTLPDVLANGLIQNLKGQLAQSEARLDQISSQLGRNHPEVQRLDADIKKQRQKLKDEIIVVATSITNLEAIAQQRENQLREQVAEQKTKLLRFNQGRDEMSVLMKEVEAAQRAYDAASARFTQTTLESQAEQTNIAVLNRAIPPLKHSFPNTFVSMVAGIIVGALLALAMALGLELLDRRVRSPEDLAASLEARVLGVLDGGRATIKTRRRWWSFRSTPTAPAS
jgi:succinoglycan biosynthesis transport protein ExoP